MQENNFTSSTTQNSFSRHIRHFQDQYTITIYNEYGKKKQMFKLHCPSRLSSTARQH